MPLDFTPFVQGYQIEPQKPHVGSRAGGTYEIHQQGLQDMLVRIIQAQFPDMVEGGSAKVTNEPAGPGALMDFSPFQAKIRAQPQPRWGDDFIVDRNAKGEVTGVRGPDTTDVMEALAPLLHEIYHSRSMKAPQGYLNGPQITENGDWKILLENAVAAGFPSISTTYGGGDKMEEFLASAVPIKQLQSKGIPVQGRLEKAAGNLKELETLHPWLADYIQERAAPEKMSRKK